MNSSGGSQNPREDKRQYYDSNSVFKGSGCQVHGIPLESEEIDLPVQDQNGNNVFDAYGNLITERVIITFCRECDAD